MDDRMRKLFLGDAPAPEIWVIKNPPKPKELNMKIKIPKPVSILCTLVDPVSERRDEDRSAGTDPAAS